MLRVMSFVLAITVGLTAGRQAEAAAADLEPIPWASATVGAVTTSVSCKMVSQSVFPDGCPGFPKSYESINGVIAISDPLFSFSARASTSIEGNVWWARIESPLLNVNRTAAIGTALHVGDVVELGISVYASYSGSFVVPNLEDARTTPVVLRVADGTIPSWFLSGKGALGDIGVSSSGVTLMLPGDAVTIGVNSSDNSAFAPPYYSVQFRAWSGVTGCPSDGCFGVKAGDITDPHYTLSGVPCGLWTGSTFPNPGNCDLKIEVFVPGVHRSADSLACRADITGDGIVNFADLASLKSAFFQRCTR